MLGAAVQVSFLPTRAKLVVHHFLRSVKWFLGIVVTLITEKGNITERNSNRQKYVANFQEVS